jgi:hypothetical protein
MNADKNADKNADYFLRKTQMTLAWAIRILLAVILLLDIPVLIKLAGRLVMGGPRAVDGWITHVALEGRFSPTSMVQNHVLIRQAYAIHALMILVAPPALYFLQKWFASRATAKQSA